MVGIVIVSHSEKLANGVQELAIQMVQGSQHDQMSADTFRLAIAAGIDDPENPLGTDAMQIYQAIESVYSDEGVVVLMDLGSAILSAEMALEFLTEDQRATGRLCEAPLVEGAIAAVVQAAAGADIEQVLAEARGALAAKAAQLSGVGSQEPKVVGAGLTEISAFPPTNLINPPVQKSKVVGAGLTEISAFPSTNLINPPVQESGVDIGQSTKEIHLTVRNQMGLHARPAAKFVATASRFESQITLQNVTAKSKPVNAKSINQVITLGVRQGHEIAIAATGVDATEALAALQQPVEANFGETSVEQLPATPLPETPPSTNAQLSGIPASPGIAIAPVVIYQSAVVGVKQQQADNPQAEWQQLQTACSTAHHQIQILRQKAAICGEEEAAIFDAHLLFLEDPAVIDNARQAIFVKEMSAAAAWKAVIDETVASYQALEDSYLQARATDVSDVGQRVLQLLTGTEIAPLDLKEPAILVADDLTPSQTAQLDPNKVLGICTVSGGATSHSGILARSLGIPAVVGVGAELLRLENGTLIALDGDTGQVWVQPDEAQLRELQLKRDN